MKVRANIVDIREDINSPRSNDNFLVDSNVWIWFSYHRIHNSQYGPHWYQKEYYPSYIEQAIEQDASLFHCELSLSELANRIENTELELFCNEHSIIDDSKIHEKQKLRQFVANIGNQWRKKLKFFRHNCPLMRSEVVKEIRNSWSQVQLASGSLQTQLCEPFANNALGELQNRCVDAYDLLLIQGAIDKDVRKVITDDKDFVTVEGIVVYTANRTIIDLANSQGKLVSH